MDLCPIARDGSVDLGTAEAHPALPDVVAATVALYGRRGFFPPWTGYVAVEFNKAVGSCGFAAPPNPAEAEIAYFTFPGHEGKGVATQMAKKLLDLLRSDAKSQGVRFVAHTLPLESASTSVLRKLGFDFAGGIQHPEDGEVWKWVRSEIDA